MRITIISLIISLFLFGNSFVSSNQNKIKRLDGSTISPLEVDRTINRLIKAAKVTGIGVAIINESKIVYVKSFGFRNKEEQKPLTQETIMYGASFTKGVFVLLYF